MVPVIMMYSRITILQQLYNELNAQNNIADFGTAMEYYISTGYDQIFTIEQIKKELQNYQNNLPTITNSQA